MDSFRRNGCLAGTGIILLLSALAFYWFYSVFLKPDVGDLIAASMHNNTLEMNRCLSHGVDVNSEEKWGWYGESEGRTPLTAAMEMANVASIALLIQSGANVNLPDGFGDLPVCVAARRGDSAIIRLLSESGANFSVICEKKSPLEVAIESGHIKAAEEINEIVRIATFKEARPFGENHKFPDK